MLYPCLHKWTDTWHEGSLIFFLTLPLIMNLIGETRPTWLWKIFNKKGLFFINLSSSQSLTISSSTLTLQAGPICHSHSAHRTSLPYKHTFFYSSTNRLHQNFMTSNKTNIFLHASKVLYDWVFYIKFPNILAQTLKIHSRIC